MYLKSIGFVYEFLEDPEFNRLTNCLDNKMKQNATKDLGCTVRKADPLEPRHLQYLWEKGYLGHDTPLKLTDTLISNWY